MRLQIIRAGFLIVFTSYVITGVAQQYQTAFADLKKIKKSYADSGYVSFKIKYSYAKISNPAAVLDTITANYKYKSGRFYCSMGPIELMQNDSINITVYKNEQMMMISNPDKRTEQKGLLIDSWDSSFVADNIDSVSLSESRTDKKLQLFFKPASTYTNCSIEYDKATYRPQKIVYTKRNNLSNVDTSDKVEDVVVTAQFAGYSTAAFNEAIFNTERFAIQKNGKWIPAAPYRTFRFMNGYFDKGYTQAK